MFHELFLIIKKPLLYILAGILVLLIIIPIGTYFFFVQDLGNKEKIMNRNKSGLTLLDRENRPFFRFYQAQDRQIVSLSDIPEFMQEAVIASEDRDFYQHKGFSFVGMFRAFFTDIEQRSFVMGGSTITQQLVKNALLSQEKSLIRKYQEIILAVEIERRFNKKDILEMYLNSAYFGEGAFGVASAAQTYFGKSVTALTPAESALLISLLPAPSAYSPLSHDETIAKKQQERVLRSMVEAGYVSASEAVRIGQKSLSYQEKHEDTNVIAPHFALYVKKQLEKKYGEEFIARSGFRVKTTLDRRAQQTAERIVANQVAALSSSHVSNGAAIGIDAKTGEILVYVGSKDWFDETIGKVDMVNTPRQPGSSFKPIVYAKALERKLITSATQLQDEPTTFPGGYAPLDYDKKFRGNVSARRALANSLNIPAVEVMQKVGVSDVLQFSQELGITSVTNAQDYGLSLVLGSGDVSLLEMTDAYAAFANHGDRPEATAILEITDKNNQIIFHAVPNTTHVLSDETSFLISSILSDPASRAEIFGNALNFSRPAAVKTGTTESYRDAWTIGYTPQMVVGVWVGNNDNSVMDSVAGSLGAAPVWRGVLQTLVASLPIETFSRPPDVIPLSVCFSNGLRAHTANEKSYTEFFLQGTAPQEYCDEAPTATPALSPTPTGEKKEPASTPEPTPTITPTSSLTPTPTETNPFPEKQHITPPPVL